MKLKFILVLFFVVLAYASEAQKAKLLVGNWQYKDVGEKENLDSIGLKMIPKYFGDMKLDFKKDSKYTATMMGKTEEGTYNVNKKETQIVLVNPKGKENIMELLDVTETELWIKFGSSGKGFIIMEKSKVPSNK